MSSPSPARLTLQTAARQHSKRLGRCLNITRERARQLEDKILTKLFLAGQQLRQYLGEGLEVLRGSEVEEEDESG